MLPTDFDETLWQGVAWAKVGTHLLLEQSMGGSTKSVLLLLILRDMALGLKNNAMYLKNAVNGSKV